MHFIIALLENEGPAGFVMTNRLRLGFNVHQHSLTLNAENKTSEKESKKRERTAILTNLRGQPGSLREKR